MEPSPRAKKTALLTGSKSPASGKKLVQARLPFSTLGGRKPPFTVSNDTSEVSLAAASTFKSSADNRKRKQDDVASNDDGIRDAKLNRCEFKNGETISLGSHELMELSNEIPAENGPEENRTSQRKKSVYVVKQSPEIIDLTDDCSEMGKNLESGAHKLIVKQSLNSEKTLPGTRKSKRSMPMAKSSTEMTNQAKKHMKTNSDTHINVDVHKKNANADPETSNDRGTKAKHKRPDNKGNADVNTSTAIREQEFDKQNRSNSDNDDSVLNESLVSKPSEQCSTPSDRKLTSKQVQGRLDSEKKKQEKEEKEQQKKREREEKDDQRKKEREMREKKLLDEKLMKQRERELKEQQRKIEREEKEEQRKRERDERELQRKQEREEKEREKEEERKKKDDEKRQKIEAEENKKRKTAKAFAKFFVPKKVENKSDANELDEHHMDGAQMPQIFKSFQLKEYMKMAPVTRRTMNCDERSTFAHTLSSGISENDLYLSQLKRNMFAPRKSGRTWPDDDDDKSSDDDLFVIEENGQNVQLFKEEPKKLYRAKFFKFSENRRPPYYGTWRKTSTTIHARKPLALDSQLDYDVDSDDEWEEEPGGESLHGSDDEKEVESEDEYEIDNEFFVPHGHLSDEELQSEDESASNNPADLKIKLKLAQNEFEDECKKKTHKLKPKLIGFVWQNMDGSKPDNCSNGIWKLMNRNAVLFNGPTVKIERPNNNLPADNSDNENLTTTKSMGGVRRLQIDEMEIPDLIRLINGNQNNSKFLVKEFCAYLTKKLQLHREYSNASIKAKIKDLAIWQACPEEGPMHKKLCWYVPIATRKRYNLNDLSFPNTWSYTIPPRRCPVKIVSTVEDNKMN